MKHAIVICSGGLDSVTLAHHVKKNLGYNDIRLLFFDYEQRALELERKCVGQCAKDIKASIIEIKLSELKKLAPSSLIEGKIVNSGKSLRATKKESLQWYVPFRNGIFISYALAYAESLLLLKKRTDIFIGFKCEGEEHFPDTTKEFLKAMNKVSNEATHGTVIRAPFIEKDKEDIIEIGIKLGVDFRKTVSCYSPHKLHCGTCLACRLRKAGFHWANIEDPTRYVKN